MFVMLITTSSGYTTPTNTMHTHTHYTPYTLTRTHMRTHILPSQVIPGLIKCGVIKDNYKDKCNSHTLSPY